MFAAWRRPRKLRRKGQRQREFQPQETNSGNGWHNWSQHWSELLPAVDFAQVVRPHASTGLSLCELELGFPGPAIRYAQGKAEPGRVTGGRQADPRGRRLGPRQPCPGAGESEKQTNMHRWEPDFDVGRKGWLSCKNLPTDRPSLSLAHKQAGPVPIVAKEGHSYRRELPESWHIRNSTRTACGRHQRTCCQARLKKHHNRR